MIQKKTPPPKPRRARSNASKQNGESTTTAVTEALAALNELKPTSPRAKKSIALLKSWLRDESGYDEEAWPQLKKALDQERDRVGARRHFDA